MKTKQAFEIAKEVEGAIDDKIEKDRLNRREINYFSAGFGMAIHLIDNLVKEDDDVMRVHAEGGAEAISETLVQTLLVAGIIEGLVR
jgi:hypothetical protein